MGCLRYFLQDVHQVLIGLVPANVGDFRRFIKCPFEKIGENVETAFLYADAVTLSKFAKVLGKLEDGMKLETFAEEVKQNYNERLLVRHPEEGYWCYRTWGSADEIHLTQAAEALPLSWTG